MQAQFNTINQIDKSIFYAVVKHVLTKTHPHTHYGQALIQPCSRSNKKEHATIQLQDRIHR